MARTTNMTYLTYPLLATKTRNLIAAALPGATLKLRNVAVNGNKRGCSGFVEYEGRCLYVNTESLCSHGVLYRTAKDSKDYCGGQNLYAKTASALEQGVRKILKGEQP